MDLMRRVYEGAMENLHGHQVQRSNLSQPGTVLCRWMKKIARTAAVCPLSSLPRRVNTLSTTLLRKRMTRRSPYTLRCRQFTLMTHLRVAGANANLVAQHTHSKRKDRVRELCCWRVVWTTLRLQLNYNNDKSACIMNTEIRRRNSLASVWQGCTPWKGWIRKTH
ncbi:unnamed protein product [Camellia sinensis]